MSSDKQRTSDFATWVGGQLKALRTYADTKTSDGIAGLRAELTGAVTQSAAQVKADILGGASAAYDTLQELQAAIQADDSAVAGLTAALAKRVRFDAVQTLTVSEQAQARANIDAVSTADLGAGDIDYVALAVAARDS